MTALRAVLSWFILLAVAFANGTIRELGYGRVLGAHRAHQLSALVGIVLLGAAIALLARRWPFATARDAWRTGLLWLGLTLAFETTFGMVQGLSWQEILGAYAVWRGELWPLCLAWLAIAPFLAFRLAATSGGARDEASDPVNAFLAARRIAVAGVSRSEKDFSRYVFAELARRGYDVVPVNPAASTIAGIRCPPRVSDVSPLPDAVLVLTAARDSEAVVRDALAAGVRNVWLHRGAGPGTATPGALAACAEHGVVPVTDLCPFMALPRAGAVHALHGAIRRWSRPAAPRRRVSATRS